VLHEISHRRPQTESNYGTLKAAKRAATEDERLRGRPHGALKKNMIIVLSKYKKTTPHNLHK